METEIITYFDDTIKCINDLKTKTQQISSIIKILKKAEKNNNKIFLMGNGGSASTASHLICDLNKFRRLHAISLTDSIPLITAWSNDCNYNIIFKEQLKTLASSDDIVIGFSGSGNSLNVIKAIEYAKKIGCYTIGFSGFNGGLLKDIADECIIVEIDNMQHSEDLHLLLGHAITFLMDIDENIKDNKKEPLIISK